MRDWARGAPVDRRSLALFRLLIALAALGDCVARLGSLHAFHTDAGVLPREVALHLDAAWRFDLFLLGGSSLFAGALLAIGALAALALAAGWRTRVASGVLFALVVSAQSRNPLVLTASDAALAAALFWAALLPLGSRWSADSAGAAGAGGNARYAAWPVAGLQLLAIVQLVLMALDPALRSLAALAPIAALLPGAWWNVWIRRLDRGTRIRVFHDDGCGTCRRLAELAATFAVLPNAELRPASESPRAQTLLQRNAATWVVLDDADAAHLDRDAWSAIARHSLLLRGLAPVLAWRLWDRPAAALGRALRSLPLRADSARRPPPDPGRGLQWLGALVLALVLAWNAALVAAPGIADGLAPPLRLLRLDSPWRPLPETSERWLVLAGALESGADVDVLRPGAALQWRPARAAADRGARWRAYHERLADAQFTPYRALYGRFLCERWNRDAAPGERLLRIDMTWVEPHPGRVPALERRVGWRQECAIAAAP